MHHHCDIPDIERLFTDAIAITLAMLEDDVDEARFRAHLLEITAHDCGLDYVQMRAAQVIDLLGGYGETPAAGHAAAIAKLSDELAYAAAFLRNGGTAFL